MYDLVIIFLFPDKETIELLLIPPTLNSREFSICLLFSSTTANFYIQT